MQTKYRPSNVPCWNKDTQCHFPRGKYLIWLIYNNFRLLFSLILTEWLQKFLLKVSQFSMDGFMRLPKYHTFGRDNAE